MARPYRKAKNSRDASKSKSNGVVVDGYSEQWLRQGFSWVYPKEVVSKPKHARPGARVDLESKSGQSLGSGIWDAGWISVRRFRADAGPIDAPLLGTLLERAKGLRDIVVDPGTSAYRLANGENDGLPGIRVDVYGHFCVVSLDAPSLHGLLDPICDWLDGAIQPRGIFLAWRPDPRDDVKSWPAEAGLVRGRAPTGDVRVTERGVACLVRPGAGKDIGLYADMRDNRTWLEPYWGGRRVLNLFAHTGMFSVVAAHNGASETVSVDLSEHYLDRAEANFTTNELDPADHSFIAGDVRQVLDRFRRTGERFDVVLLDPPSFSHGPAGAWSAKNDYARMVTSCLRVLEPGGWFVAALNLGEVSPRDFHNAIRTGARKAGKSLQLLFDGGQAADHCAAIDHPEGRYLKFGVWRAV